MGFTFWNYISTLSFGPANGQAWDFKVQTAVDVLLLHSKDVETPAFAYKANITKLVY